MADPQPALHWLDVAVSRGLPAVAAFEMHAHSRERSLDSGAPADALVAAAAARGLSGICLTDHNACWPETELRALGDRHSIAVFGGMELGTDAGHVLVYGLATYRPQMLVLEQLRPIVQSEGAVMALAHPMRAFAGAQPPWNDFPLWFDAVEVVNGDHSDTADGYIARETQRLGLATIGGSDAHTVQAVGRVATGFAHEVRAIQDIPAAIRSRSTFVVDLRA